MDNNKAPPAQLRKTSSFCFNFTALLEKPLSKRRDSEAVQKAKTLYASCMNESKEIFFSRLWVGISVPSKTVAIFSLLFKIVAVFFTYNMKTV